MRHLGNINNQNDYSNEDNEILGTERKTYLTILFLFYFSSSSSINLVFWGYTGRRLMARKHNDKEPDRMAIVFHCSLL